MNILAASVISPPAMKCLSTCHIPLQQSHQAYCLLVCRTLLHNFTEWQRYIIHWRILPSTVLTLNIDPTISRGFPILCYFQHQKHFQFPMYFSRRILTDFMAPSLATILPKSTTPDVLQIGLRWTRHY